MTIEAQRTIPRAPALFVGHGSPMNIIADNSYTQSLRHLGQKLPTPKAILAVSAHWETAHTEVLSLDWPRTIYDFGGFPQALYEISYPAPGAPDQVEQILQSHPELGLKLCTEWGFDHGVWAVLHHLLPKANIPIIPLSLNRRFGPAQHLELAQKLRPLRDEGYMILGSGNVTHNLGDLDWEQREAAAFPWAQAFDQRILKALSSRDTEGLLGRDPAELSAWKQAHPRREHYWPLLYVYGASHPDESLLFFHEGFEHGSLSMRCFIYGLDSVR